MSQPYLLRWAEEVLARPDPAKPTMAQPSQDDPEMARHEAALAFVNGAGARLVAACPLCHPDAPAGAEYLVLVPAVNDGHEFRAALAILRIPYGVVARHDPLEYLPARCEHVRGCSQPFQNPIRR